MSNIIKVLTLLIFLILSLKVAATSQYGDILIMEGDTLILFSNPLHSRPDWKELSVGIWNELENEDKKLYPQKYEAEEVEVMWSSHVTGVMLLNGKYITTVCF